MAWEGGEKQKRTQPDIQIDHRLWVRYGNQWYDPLEWYYYCRKVGMNLGKGSYRDITKVLEEAQRIIMRRIKEGKDVSHYLPKYFEFEKRVFSYYHTKALYGYGQYY